MTNANAAGALELEAQMTYISRVAERNASLSVPPKYYIATYGCQMNAHDSERLSGMLAGMGYAATDTEDEADLVVYNTCCIRENAENRVFGRLGYLKHLKSERPSLKIALCGCMMQQGTTLNKLRASYRFVDIVFGTYNLHRFPELLFTSIETGAAVIDIWDKHGALVEDLPVKRQSPYKAGINIMYGCDNFCAYCVVPYVRGRERSREPEGILSEIQRYAEEGAREVLLLGQNVNSYGKGLAEPLRFPALLERVCAVPGIERVRFMTSHPKDLSPELIRAMGGLPKVCKHIHLPVQSGSDRVLAKMNRRYTVERYMSLLENLRREIPGVSVTTDIITAFPGETEEDFEQTLELVRRARFNGAFTFIYSKRSGTPAAEMDGQVPEDVAGTRFQRLLETLNPIIYEINRGYEGRTLDVLAEEYEESRGVLTGRADDNSLVHFSGRRELLGRVVKVRIAEGKPFYLLGEMAE